jgi:hypothetical protein
VNGFLDDFVEVFQHTWLHGRILGTLCANIGIKHNSLISLIMYNFVSEALLEATCLFVREGGLHVCLVAFQNFISLLKVDDELIQVGDL